jgi:hypothetical protein
MGRNPAQGRGGRAEQERAPVAFKTERQKVHTGKGAIVGQLVFEGEQVPGEVTSDLSKTIAASEREASDLIHRDRVPRQYHKAVRSYFSKVNRDLNGDRNRQQRTTARRTRKLNRPSRKKTNACFRGGISTISRRRGAFKFGCEFVEHRCDLRALLSGQSLSPLRPRRSVLRPVPRRS